MSKAPDNRDALYGIHIPRGSYALTGRQLAPSLSDNAGKKPTDGPPMIITDMTPGVFTDDWNVTYGASRDAFLSIINGVFVQQAIDEISVTSIYKDGMVNGDDDNLWKMATPPEGEIQQVQYIVSKTTIDEASEVGNSYGEISEARGIGLRIPTIAGGYGRTIDGRPTDPNPVEDPHKRKNDEAHKLARETWKYGPIEYRWDYRRGVWSAYNELIADHEEQDIGTWVFGTNSDEEQGFPFLRGRLEDVFWVRQPHDLRDQDGTVEGVKTGEVMTHLEHRWYDDSENAAAKLSSIFIIPHAVSASEEGDDEGCHFKVDDDSIHELGDETTASADRIDIKTEVHFFKELGVDGPVKFGRKVSELDDLLCCHNPRAKFMFGEMIFLDEALPTCEGQSASSSTIQISTGGDPERCKWVPAIQIDECELMGDHMVKLVKNDQQLGKRISDFCNIITEYTGDMATVFDANTGTFQTAIECLIREFTAAEASVNAALAISWEAMTAHTYFIVDEINSKLQDLVDQINQALQTCGCEPTVNGIEITQSKENVPEYGQVTFGDCDLGSLSRAPEVSCDECYGIPIYGPCTTQETFIAGEACADYEMRDVTTEFGNCDTHEDTA